MINKRNVTYVAIHEKTRWRPVRGHTSLANALEGKNDGAPGLFAKKARIDFAKHGEPLFVLVWQDGDLKGFVVKKDVSTSSGCRREDVPVEILLGYQRQKMASLIELERYFAPEKLTVSNDVVPSADESANGQHNVDINTRSFGADDAYRLGTIKSRRGQSHFRKSLINAYGGKCAVTASSIIELLEAAHIVPHAAGTDYRIQNGLLLRADFHTLYDLHLFSVDEYCRLHLSKTLNESEYRKLHGKNLLVLPNIKEQQPSKQNLKARHQRFLLQESMR
jgi:hypothetical protein